MALILFSLPNICCSPITDAYSVPYVPLSCSPQIDWSRNTTQHISLCVLSIHSLHLNSLLSKVSPASVCCPSIEGMIFSLSVLFSSFSITGTFVSGKTLRVFDLFSCSRMLFILLTLSFEFWPGVVLAWFLSGKHPLATIFRTLQKLYIL